MIFFFLREFQSMAFASDNRFLSSDQDINQFQPIVKYDFDGRYYIHFFFSLSLYVVYPIIQCLCSY